jgi:hypothetical protein
VGGVVEEYHHRQLLVELGPRHVIEGYRASDRARVGEHFDTIGSATWAALIAVQVSSDPGDVHNNVGRGREGSESRSSS